MEERAQPQSHAGRTIAARRWRRARVIRLGLIAAVVLAAAPAATRAAPAAPAMAADHDQDPRGPRMSKPRYLSPMVDPTFGSRVTRIGNDPGQSTAPVSGTWGTDTRHVYSKQQPWSADGALLVIENRGGGSPSPLFLDGTSYRPKLAPCSGANLYDYRWHPTRAHPHELINVNAAGTQLAWYDVTTCTQTRAWTLPITVDYGIGSGEGNPSADGRFVALGTTTDLFVVDMDPQPPYAPYPNPRIGPVYHLPPESLLVASPGTWTLGNLSVSPSGRYVDFKFAGPTDTTADLHRIFEVDPVTLALTPHAMAGAALRCGSFAARPNGWIFPLKHADMTFDPFDHNEDILVGGRACPGSSLGRVVKVRLRDGAVTALTDPTNESPVYHVSTRNLERPGWAYVSYFKVAGKRFSDEIVAVKLDGSLAVERLAHTHTAASGCYRCEAHPVPSRDGTRVLFASNWAQDCDSCGRASVIAPYVITVKQDGPAWVAGPARDPMHPGRPHVDHPAAPRRAGSPEGEAP